jgi:hypothetical protein
VLSTEATNTNFIIFGFTGLGLKSTIYRTRDEHVDHYTTDAVLISNFLKMQQKFRGSQEPVIAHLVSISLINFKEKFQLDLLLVI